MAPVYTPTVLSTKYQLNENIQTTRLMFSAIIINLFITFYASAVFYNYSVDIADLCQITESEANLLVRYGPWKTSTVGEIFFKPAN